VDRNGKDYRSAILQAVTRPGGVTSVTFRKKIVERAAACARGETGPDLGSLNQVVDHIATKPVAAEVERLLAEGQSEDAVFEIVVAAAVGAGMERVKRALQVLDEVAH
jgi:hypothetical protein